MSKPMLVTLPFLLLLLDYWPLGRWQKALNPPRPAVINTSKPPDKKKKKLKAVVIGEKKILAPVKRRRQLVKEFLGEKAPFILLSMILSISLIWQQKAVGGIASLEIITLPMRIINAIVSYVAYLGKFFWPVNLAVFYPYQHSFPLWQIFGSVFILLGVSFAVVYLAKRIPFLLVGWLWYLVTLFPVIGLLQAGAQARADRYTYLPSIGIALMLVWGLLNLMPGEKQRKMILLPVAVIVLVIFTILTWQQCGQWKNSFSIFSHALSVTENNYLAHNNIGIALAEEGRNDQAISHYLAALEINPFYDSAHGNLGVTLAASGKNEEAIARYLEAIKINPANYSAHSNLGVILAAQGKNEEAIARYLEAVKIDTASADAHYNLANLLMKQGKMDEAVNHYREAIKINPEHGDAHYNFAEVLVKQGSIDQAIEHFREAARIKPSSFKALNNLGVHLEKQLRHDEAIEYYRRALQIEPENHGLYFNLGVALGNKGELSQAIEHFRRAIYLKPDYEDARRALKLALELQKQKR